VEILSTRIVILELINQGDDEFHIIIKICGKSVVERGLLYTALNNLIPAEGFPLSLWFVFDQKKLSHTSFFL
jgi:hypothetical protein